MLYLDNVILKKSDSIPGFTYELQSTPNFNNFWRVIYCSCLLSLIDIHLRVGERTDTHTQTHTHTGEHNTVSVSIQRSEVTTAGV